MGSEMCIRDRANFNGFRVLPSLMPRRRSPKANQTLHDVWPSPALVHYVYIHFRGFLPPDGILSGAKFTLRPCLAFSYIASVTARHAIAAGVSQTLRRGRPTRNGITELSQRAQPIFGRTAITLGIGPHFSFGIGLLYLLLTHNYLQVDEALTSWLP